jgi:hypothetical protein
MKKKVQKIQPYTLGILQETKDLLNAVMNLLSDYNESHDSSVKPAKLDR